MKHISQSNFAGTNSPTCTTSNSSCNDKAMKYQDSLTSVQQFILLTLMMFVFFALHNILQEAMMKVPGFKGVMLAYMEVLG